MAVQETSLGSVMTAHTLQSAEGQGTTATIELCLRIPRQARSVRLSIAFQKAFLTVFDHPPDANRGFDMPSALITNMLAQPLHQVSCIFVQVQYMRLFRHSESKVNPGFLWSLLTCDHMQLLATALDLLCDTR